MEQDWTAEEDVYPALRHHLDQTEAWAVETARHLVRLQANFYRGLEKLPTSRLASFEEVVQVVSALDPADAGALLYLFISHAAEEEAGCTLPVGRVFGRSKRADRP